MEQIDHLIQDDQRMLAMQEMASEVITITIETEDGKTISFPAAVIDGMLPEDLLLEMEQRIENLTNK